MRRSPMRSTRVRQQHVNFIAQNMFKVMFFQVFTGLSHPQHACQLVSNMSVSSNTFQRKVVLTMMRWKMLRRCSCGCSGGISRERQRYQCLNCQLRLKYAVNLAPFGCSCNCHVSIVSKFTAAPWLNHRRRMRCHHRLWKHRHQLQSRSPSLIQGRLVCRLPSATTWVAGWAWMAGILVLKVSPAMAITAQYRKGEGHWAAAMAMESGPHVLSAICAWGTSHGTERRERTGRPDLCHQTSWLSWKQCRTRFTTSPNPKSPWTIARWDLGRGGLRELLGEVGAKRRRRRSSASPQFAQRSRTPRACQQHRRSIWPTTSRWKQLLAGRPSRGSERGGGRSGRVKRVVSGVKSFTSNSKAVTGGNTMRLWMSKCLRRSCTSPLQSSPNRGDQLWKPKHMTSSTRSMAPMKSSLPPLPDWTWRKCAARQIVAWLRLFWIKDGQPYALDFLHLTCPLVKAATSSSHDPKTPATSPLDFSSFYPIFSHPISLQWKHRGATRQEFGSKAQSAQAHQEWHQGSASPSGLRRRRCMGMARQQWRMASTYRKCAPFYFWIGWRLTLDFQWPESMVALMDFWTAKVP